MTMDRVIDEPAVAEALESLCRKHRVLRLSLFGSGAAGTLTDESDLDFMVEFEGMPPSAHADAYFGLLANLEAVCQRRIDLLERSAIENPYLLRRIERSRRLIYEAA
ncbi:MAG TPA: nucleotidyltransferase domain-containing protein [Thermoanaerobaculia bacterium]|nr:nucleotidyltransferase domain-containing protein [Thermoanaerobaculia bacterium]